MRAARPSSSSNFSSSALCLRRNLQNVSSWYIQKRDTMRPMNFLQRLHRGVYRLYILSHGVQPCVQRRSKVGVAQARRRPSTLRMPTHNHLLNLQMRNRILDDTGGANISGMHAIRNIPMHEDIARRAIANRRLWNARICAAYPEYLRPLALCEVGKSIRICFGGFLRKVSIPGNDAVDGI